MKGEPAKIFLMIGVNDIARNTPVNSIANSIEQIIRKIKEETPTTKIYLQSVLPINPDFEMFVGHMKPDSIISLNHRIKNLSDKYNVPYVDLYSDFVIEGTDKLSPQYTNDGLHLLGEGYIHWSEIIKPFLYE